MFSQEALTAERDRLYRFALRLTKQPSDAEDLVQSTMLRALEKREYFQEGTNLFNWTSRVMFNIFVSQYRRAKRIAARHDAAFTEAHSITQAPQETVTDLSRMRDCMKRLSKPHRDMLVMVCISGLRYEEVSQKLRIPVGTVRSRLSRARNELQHLLQANTGTQNYRPAHGTAISAA
ncbi:MAG: polymerase, sigma-24 subunit, subfamily [Alphaproteobacteria bacterium]|jgi:RNA polymerase sigma factor (sigma-70 family)|nr:polymerase, sigma-24 subunit, subfamily [Alphaproteobacteria bacterium]